MLSLTYRVLNEMFRESEKNSQKNIKSRTVYSESVDLVDTEKSMLVEGEILCSACENTKITLVRDGKRFYVLTDFMNTVPIRIRSSHEEYVVEIGLSCQEGEIKEDSKDVKNSKDVKDVKIGSIPKGKAVVIESDKVYVVNKKCIHVHQCSEIEGRMCPFKDNENYLEHLLCCALSKIVEGKKDLFISFSGGIDSLLCATLCCEYFSDRRIYLVNTCFSRNGVFLSRDRQSAVEFYEKIQTVYPGNFILLKNDIDREEILQNKNVIMEVSRATTMDFNLAALHYFTARKVRELGGKSIITGTGGDELFMGYSRHRKIASDRTLPDEDIDRMLKDAIYKDVDGFWKTNLHRDYAAGSILGVIPASPFLDPFVFEYSIRTAKSTDVEKKSLTEILHRKYPGAVLKKKLAGQYGSGIADVIRSIQCRAPTLCRKNECLSIECSRKRDSAE